MVRKWRGKNGGVEQGVARHHGSDVAGGVLGLGLSLASLDGSDVILRDTVSQGNDGRREGGDKERAGDVECRGEESRTGGTKSGQHVLEQTWRGLSQSHRLASFIE